MAYRALEQVLSRKNERVFMLVSLQNFFGIAALGLPTFLLTESLGLIARVAATILAGVLGHALTTEVRGMALYERAFWMARGVLAGMLTPPIVRPADIPGTRYRAAPLALPVGGPVRAIRRPAGQCAAPPAHGSSRAVLAVARPVYQGAAPADGDVIAPA